MINHSTQVKHHLLADRGHDVYETPLVAVRALLAVEHFPKVIWEPACGPGAIVCELRNAGYAVVATDLIEYRCPHSGHGFNFLNIRRAPQNCRCIVTNPPFKDAHAFVRHALELVPNVAMLLRLAFLEGERRKDVLDTGRLRRVHVFSRRLPMMHRAGWEGPKASSAVAFAWFVWDDKSGATRVDRINWKRKS
jgi:hypothetical protein